jgi:hypothetical protein
MKQIVFGALFFITTIAAKAQVTTNIYWTEQTNLPASRVIYYNPSRNLQWPDFDGTPQTSGIVAAITMSGFGYTASMKRNGNKGEINIGIYCYFSKDKSWVKPDKKTAYILNHEQHHFDISYIAARIFADRLKNTVITSSNVNVLIPRIYKECCDIMNKLQDDYDGQTKNGQVKEMQERWNNSLGEKLVAFTK